MYIEIVYTYVLTIKIKHMHVEANIRVSFDSSILPNQIVSTTEIDISSELYHQI